MARVTADEEKELHDPETWEDGEEQEPRPGRAPRAIVSVAFSRDDFERVADFAQSNNMKISEMIRNAALERVSDQMRTVYWPATLADTDARWSIDPQDSEIVQETAVPA